MADSLSLSPPFLSLSVNRRENFFIFLETTEKKNLPRRVERDCRISHLNSIMNR